ncbi:hypothetical protein DSO57_1027796 [Entomophthora muscae]|uniref:Uncharacterized protein n=1 Tax=Entomophthora muscae TaxID=34485 RepID=A0ACC2TZX6_9FUNG|nr:hypothetical protein DSO57_1027796 [Entomophthora muscae]
MINFWPSCNGLAAFSCWYLPTTGSSAGLKAPTDHSRYIFTSLPTYVKYCLQTYEVTTLFDVSLLKPAPAHMKLFYIIPLNISANFTILWTARCVSMDTFVSAASFIPQTAAQAAQDGQSAKIQKLRGCIHAHIYPNSPKLPTPPASQSSSKLLGL